MTPELQSSIKHKFFTYRNGIVADALRSGGYPQRMIFGLDVPQIASIARELQTSLDKATLADAASWLWSDSNVRESRLLACYLFEPIATDETGALRLASDVRTQEEADMLAFRLLKRLPDPARLLELIRHEEAASTDSTASLSMAARALARFVD
ncbi:MAG: DNA alkylation repair protein [Muribaculaceae bacterium]|nr:DNA alkylation repair protein [Muribaculaceae bacterium]